MATNVKTREAAPKTSKYSTPGEGRSSTWSALSIVAILLAWWLASHLR